MIAARVDRLPTLDEIAADPTKAVALTPAARRRLARAAIAVAYALAVPAPRRHAPWRYHRGPALRARTRFPIKSADTAQHQAEQDRAR